MYALFRSRFRKTLHAYVVIFPPIHISEHRQINLRSVCA